jgi:hypothetical protein
MKPNKALTLVLALTLLIAPILVAKPGFAAPVSYDVYPTAVAPLTDIDPSAYVLETPGTPSPVGQTFNVVINLTGAIPGNVPAGVAGVEVHFDFSTILSHAAVQGFTNMLGTAGGVLNVPLLYGITAGFYKADGTTLVTVPPYTDATQYIVAAASSGGGWNGAAGGIVIIQFTITAQPSALLGDPDFVAGLNVSFGSAVDGAAAEVTVSLNQGTLHLDAAPPIYPAIPHIYITPVDQTGPLPIGSLFNYTVMINADSFWDVAGFDITVNWNDTLLNLVAYSEGDFLHQAGADTFGFYNVLPGSIQAVFTKLIDVTPSGGTGSLLQLQFATAHFSNSFPGASCAITLDPTDLASWAHEDRPFAPWFGSITAVDLPYPDYHTRANAMYHEPVQILGAAIDLYSQYADPFGGQGPFEHSDSFAPQQLVCLYAKVTFGGDRVTNKLVVFEIHNALGDKITILQNYSDINGIATVCFRIPQTDLTPPEDPAIFGWWNVISTVELDQITVNDTMYFQVGWLAKIVSVDANGAPYLKYSDNMDFTATLLTIHEQPIWVLVSIDSYDVMGYPIGETAFWVEVNATRASSPFIGPDDTTTGGVYVYPDIIQHIPTWARVGTASVVGYALTDWPRNGGTPYGPQSPATIFGIILS